MTDGFKRTLIWILGSMLAVMAAMAMLSAAFDGHHYVPVGNDSFYHARRILDAVANPAGYYEFDPKIHAPEGALLTWPWAYDLGVAWLIRAAMALGISADPVKLMDYVPVAFVPVAIALILTISVQLRLSLWSQIVAVLCVALSPLVQLLFGVGCIDHHYVEYLFVLGTLSAGIGWMNQPASLPRAALLGVVLGIAPAFQNGLFILQLPLLLCLSVLHLRRIAPPTRAAMAFALALVLSTLLMLLPSQPFRMGMFAYYFFSWFHMYVAFCTAALAVLLSRFASGTRTTLMLCALAILMAAPLLGQIWLSSHYFSAQLENQYRIGEVQTLFQQIRGDGWILVLNYYSWLLFLMPLVFVGCGWYLLRRGRDPALVLLCMSSVVGLVLLISKFRLQNFGSFALFLPLLWALDQILPAAGRRRWVALAAATAVLLAAYAKPVLHQLSAPQWLGKSSYYALTTDIFPAIHDACETAPGIVLASNDDGHYIRYHSDCSVIADNFMLTRQDADSVAEMTRLMSLTPQQLLTAATDIRYVYARLDLIMEKGEHGEMSAADDSVLQSVNLPLVNALIFTPLDQIDPHYHLVKELQWTHKDGHPYARLFRIDRDAASTP